MTDDELLELARKADDNGEKLVVPPIPIIALIERHRAEVEAIKRHLDEAEIAMPSGTPNWTLAERVKIACIAATDESDRAEIERLTRERDEAKEGQDGALEWADIQRRHADAMQDRAEAAEAALAAAEARTREECAKIVDDYKKDDPEYAICAGYRLWLAAAIRAGGER